MNQDDFDAPPELRLKYLERKTAEIAAIRAAAAPDREALQRLGHQMKGNAVTFGFPSLGEIGAAMESAAKSGDEGSLRALVDRLERDVARYASEIKA